MLTFDADKHEYRFDGHVVPGVTTVLAPISGLSPFVAESVMQAARELGTAVHLATELYDNGSLDESDLDEKLVPYLDAWKRFKVEKKVKFHHREARVFNERYRYAGTFDGLGEMDGKICLFDIKTGEMYPSYGPQLAAYNACLARAADERWCVRLMDDGRYALDNLSDKDDWQTFLGCLAIYRFKQKKGIKQ